MPPQEIERLPDLLGDGLELGTHGLSPFRPFAGPVVGSRLSVGEEVFRAGPFVNSRGQ
jgi:hypothetical protein